MDPGQIRILRDDLATHSIWSVWFFRPGASLLVLVDPTRINPSPLSRVADSFEGVAACARAAGFTYGTEIPLDSGDEPVPSLDPIHLLVLGLGQLALLTSGPPRIFRVAWV